MIISQETLRNVQKIELGLLKELDSICRKNDISYYLFYGSLIGAVRHKGFIPWDDDIDVVMRRCDYEKFIQIAPSLIPPNMFLQTPYTDLNTIYSFAKLRDSNTTYIEERCRTIHMHQGVWLDIFCLDNIPVTYFQKAKINIFRRINDYSLYDWQNDDLTRSQYDFVHKFGVKLLKILYPNPRDGALRNDILYKSIKNNESSKFINYNTIYKNEIIPDNWLGKGMDVCFEDIIVRIPDDYDSCLRMIYGDYMQYPPEKERIPRHEVAIVDLDKSYKNYF